MKMRRIALALGAAGILLAGGYLLTTRLWPPDPGFPINRQIQYSFTLQNVSNQTLKKAEFWAHAPVRQTAYQKCEHLNVSHPYELLTDAHGNQSLYFKLPDMPPFATVIISVKASLALSDTPNRLPGIHPTDYLNPEPFCESTAPEIVRHAASFGSSKSTAVEESFFNWVASNIHYAGYVRNERGALYALTNRQGDCTEFMYLFAALCRARAIPARTIGGYLCRGNKVLTPGEYHNWVEFFDGRLWRLADPQRKIWLKESSHYIAMRVIGEAPHDPMAGFHRFRFAGEGLKVKMNG